MDKNLKEMANLVLANLHCFLYTGKLKLNINCNWFAVHKNITFGGILIC